MTDVSSALVRELVSELVGAGVDQREARWLVEEYVPGGEPAARAALAVAARRRVAGEPLQYVLGHWPFRGLDLDLDSRVLIPRPETEGVVDVALAQLARTDVAAPTILDLGCGSGAIGLALLVELGQRGVVASLVALDESTDALDVARRNARKHRQLAVTFVRSSWFDALDSSLRGRFDLVVANPPYVGEGQFDSLDPVLRFEPRGALVAPDAHGVAGFADLAVIIAGTRAWLSPGGALVCEHGADQRDDVLLAARRAGYGEVADLDDLAGRPRVLVARA